MTVVELARLVAEVREAQRDYFRTRSLRFLDLSRLLERKLDRAVREVLDQQGRLFVETDPPYHQESTRP